MIKKVLMGIVIVIFATVIVVGIVIAISKENYIKGLTIVILYTVCINYYEYGKKLYKLFKEGQNQSNYVILKYVLRTIVSGFSATTLVGILLVEKVYRLDLTHESLTQLFSNVFIARRLGFTVDIGVILILIVTLFVMALTLIKKSIANHKEINFFKRPLKERLLEIKYKK